MLSRKQRIAKRKARIAKWDAYWNDPYKVESMSNSEVLEKKRGLLIRGIVRIILGLLIIALVVIGLAMFWNDIFYNPNGWFF